MVRLAQTRIILHLWNGLYAGQSISQRHYVSTAFLSNCCYWVREIREKPYTIRVGFDSFMFLHSINDLLTFLLQEATAKNEEQIDVVVHFDHCHFSWLYSFHSPN